MLSLWGKMVAFIYKWEEKKQALFSQKGGTL